MHEHLRQVKALCEQRHDETRMHRIRIIDFLHTNGELETVRHSGFKIDHQNEVTLDGQLAMFSTDIPVRMGLRIRKIMELHESVDVGSGIFFFVPPGVTVPCHKDEEAHEGYRRGQNMLTFNVSSPKAMLYVNQTGVEAGVEFGVTGFFSTVLCPTQIHHGVINGPDPLYLVQFPINPT